jgi:hypothetical protein
MLDLSMLTSTLVSDEDCSVTNGQPKIAEVVITLKKLHGAHSGR